MADPSVRILRVATSGELDRVHQLRLGVFVHEQGVSLAEELDDHDHDPGVVHLLAVAGEQDAGTARVLPHGPGRVHVTRVAVASPYRGHGLGRALMAAAEQIAASEYAHDGRVQVELSAQEGALGFYRGLGYTIGSQRYLDAGIRHAAAVKVLPATPGRPEARDTESEGLD